MGAWEHFLNPKRMSEELASTREALLDSREEVRQLEKRAQKREKLITQREEEIAEMKAHIREIMERPDPTDVERLTEKWEQERRRLTGRIEVLEMQLEEARESLRMMVQRDEYREIDLLELDPPEHPVLPTEEEMEAEARKNADAEIEAEAHRRAQEEDQDWLKTFDD